MNRASIVRTLNLFLTGILIGAMFEEYLLLKIVLKDLSIEDWVATHANFALVHPYTIIPIAVVASVALVLTLVWDKDLKSTRGILTLVGLVFFVAIGILTAAVMLPANDEIQAWARDGVPAKAAEIRETWTQLQGVRALFGLLGFLPLCIAALLPRPTRVP